jgi:CheY-like chemotaxis protein
MRGILRLRAAAVTIAQEDLAARGLRQAGRHLRLTVEDTGHGMDEATRARVFEPFFTTKGQHGTGLGLPAVYGAVVHAGGSVDVRSRPGEGSSFTIHLPEAGPVAAACAPDPPDVTGGGREILVVEDEAAVRLLAARALEAVGFSVHTAESAEVALRKLEREGMRPALLLSDVVMPGASGAQLAARAQALLPGLPVLLTSGHAGDFERAIAGAEHTFLRKPFTREELLQAVTLALAATPARAQS